MGGLAQLIAVLGTIASLGSSQALGVDEIIRQNFPALRLSPEGRDGKRRVTSGTLILNGKTVATGAQIGSQVEFLELPLGASLPVSNTLRVDVEGNSDAFVTIVVEEIDAKVQG